MKSILGEQDSCYICGRTGCLHEHHVFYGKNRKNSEKYGMKVMLCAYCHERVHRGKDGHELGLRLKQEFQRLFENRYSREKFMRVFGRSYL